jgi:hypothetical protein
MSKDKIYSPTPITCERLRGHGYVPRKREPREPQEPRGVWQRSDNIVALIRKLHRMGLSQLEIGRQLGVTRHYVRRAMGYVCT